MEEKELNILSKSSYLLTTLGNPKIEKGGSSGWIQSLISYLSQTGIIWDKKLMRFDLRISELIPSYSLIQIVQMVLV